MWTVIASSHAFGDACEKSCRGSNLICVIFSCLVVSFVHTVVFIYQFWLGFEPRHYLDHQNKSAAATGLQAANTVQRSTSATGSGFIKRVVTSNKVLCLTP